MMKQAYATSRPAPKLGRSRQHIDRIRRELKAAGAMWYDLLLFESKSLPNEIHENEHIKGVVYGHYQGGTGALVATDQRVIFIDKKLLFIRVDDIPFNKVSGVSYNYIGHYGTVILHTKIGDYNLRTFNLGAANKFYDYIDTVCIEGRDKESSYD